MPTNLLPFLSLTPEQQEAMGLDEATRATIADYGRSIGYAPPFKVTEGASLPYQAGEVIRQGAADVGRQLIAPIKPAIDAVGAVAGAVPEFVGGLAGNVLPSAQAATPVGPSDDGSAAAARIAQARATMPMQPGARPGGGGAPGGFGALEKEAKDAFAKQESETAAAAAQAAKADESARAAQEAENKLIARQAEQDAIAVDARNRKMAEIDEDNRRNQTERQNKEKEAVTKVDELNAAWRDAKVDANRIYKNKDGSTNYAKKVGAALMVGLDTLGMAIRGASGPNGALQILDQAIDRDIAEQREAIANAKDKATVQRQYLSDLRAQFGNERAAELAYADSVEADFRRQVESTLANTNSETAKTAGVKLIAAMDARSADRRRELAQIIGQEHTQSVQLRTGIRTAATNAALQSKELDARMAAAGAKTTPFEKEGAEIQGNAQAVLGKIAALREFVLGPDGVGREVFPTDVAKKAKAMAKDLQLALKEQKKMGTLDKGSEAFLESLITSDPTQMNQGALKAQLDALEAGTKSDALAQLRARGLVPQAPRFTTQGAAQ